MSDCSLTQRVFNIHQSVWNSLPPHIRNAATIFQVRSENAFLQPLKKKKKKNPQNPAKWLDRCLLGCSVIMCLIAWENMKRTQNG